MNPGAGKVTGHSAGIQAGMVLLLCLIFLTALTLLGLAASADTVLQNQLFANLQETERTKQSALATLSRAERWLLGLEPPAPEPCLDACDGLIVHKPGDLPPFPEFEDLSWWRAHSHVAGANPLNNHQSTKVGNADEQSLWIIEKVHTIPAREAPARELQAWYRILARASNRTGTVVSVIESTVVRSWPDMDGNQMHGDRSPGTCPDAGPAKKCGRVSWRELR
jgi:Tfp pilus assembly protein PilX